MGAMNKLLEWVGFDQGIEEEQDIYEDSHTSSMSEKGSQLMRRKSGKVLSLNEITKQLKVVIQRPNDFEQAQEIADHLKARKPVVINLEGLDKSVAKRIIDFLSGAVYALDGNIQKVAASIFFIAPNNVGIVDEAQDNPYGRVPASWNN